VEGSSSCLYLSLWKNNFLQSSFIDVFASKVWPQCTKVVYKVSYEDTIDKNVAIEAILIQVILGPSPSKFQSPCIPYRYKSVMEDGTRYHK